MTRDDFVQLLLAAYHGPGSTEEGTFAGDVLRACAEGMAQLWSLDIDGLERRAFVSTAVGDCLTMVCADRGVPRREGESDEDLRQRTIEKLARLPASGNEDDYREWCARVEGIARIAVLGLARGRGTVDVVAMGPDGRRPSQAALDEAQAIIRRERPVGVDARVFGAEEAALNVSASVTLMDGASLEQVRLDFAAALEDYCRERALRTRTVSYAQTMRLLLDCPGAADVTGFTLCGKDESLTLPERAVPVPGVLNLRRAGT